LFEYRDKMLEEIAKTDNQIALHQTALNLENAPSHFDDHVRQLLADRRVRELQLAGIDTEISARPALALGCLCFVLVGCPIGIWFSRNDYLSAFITCFLPIVITYYPLMLCSLNLAKGGKIIPWTGIWIADGLMLLTALFLFRRLARN
jgi:lipopolysaccharide export system permease protein